MATILLVVGVGLLLTRLAGFSEVRDAVERADARWFAGCLMAQVLALTAYAFVIRGAFRWRGGPDPGFGTSAHVMLAGIGATRVFAAGGVGAIAVAYWCFRRARFAADDAFARVLGLNVLFYVAFGVGVWSVSLLAALGWWGDARPALTAPWLVVVPLLAAAALLLTQPRHVSRFRGRRGSALRRAVAWTVTGLAWAREVLGARAGRPLVAATAVYWAGALACLWASLRSVDESLPLHDLILAFAAGHVALILPLPLGGAGGVEAALTSALTTAGVPLAPALVAVGVYRLFTFWMPTIPALAALLLVRRAGDRLERIGTSTP